MAEKGMKALAPTGRDILITTLEGESKTLMAQIGDATSGTEGEPAEIWQQVGICSRPSKANASGRNLQCAQVFPLSLGASTIGVVTRDTRYSSKAGDTGDGEVCIYAAGENGEGEAKIYLRSSGLIELRTVNGHAVKLSGDGFEVSAPSGTVTVKAGTSVSIDGVTVTLAGDSAQPVVTQAEMATLQTTLTAMQAEIAAALAAVAALVPGTGVLDPTGSIQTAAASALTAGALAVTQGAASISASLAAKKTRAA